MKGSRTQAEVFEECLERVIAGETIDDCLRDCLKRWPDQADGLRPLLETAVAARRAILATSPSPEFMARARREMLAAQTELSRPVRRSPRFLAWHPAWAMTLASVVLVLTAGAGTALASRNSMPDHPLYSVKHGIDSMRLSLARSTDAKAELYASLADQRVREIVYLAQRDDTGRIESTTKDLARYLGAVASLSGGTPEMTTLSSQAGAAQSGSPNLDTAMPKPTASAAAPSTGASAPSTENVTILETPAPLSRVAVYSGDAAGSGTKSKLASVLIQQSASNLAQLMAALDNAAPETKPALLQAIAVSQSGYEKAVQSLQVP